LEKAKATGKIKHIGFSFHDNLETFKKIVDEYENFEFCQIQYNYIDEDTEKRPQNPGWQGLKYAGKKELGVIIMEPLRGGLLANPPVGVRNIFANAEVPRLPAEWAFRFVWENQEVVTALSGMNSEDQILVNSAVASTAFPNSMPNSQIEVIKKLKLGLIQKSRCLVLAVDIAFLAQKVFQSQKYLTISTQLP
jgi:predicted aldo/keto reductase-like oxidoreductase